MSSVSSSYSSSWDWGILLVAPTLGGGNEDILGGKRIKVPKAKYKPSVLGSFLPKGFKRNKKASLTGFEIRPRR
jgi:hypothetical protein